MNILISDLTTLIKKYEKCRKPAKNFGKATFLKKKLSDSVLLPIDKVEKLSNALEKSDNFHKTDIIDFVKRLPSAGNREVYTLDQLKHELYLENGL